MSHIITDKRLAKVCGTVCGAIVTDGQYAGMLARLAAHEAARAAGDEANFARAVESAPSYAYIVTSPWNGLRRGQVVYVKMDCDGSRRSMVTTSRSKSAQGMLFTCAHEAVAAHAVQAGVLRHAGAVR